MRKTVAWYLDNPTWVEHVVSGEYRQWMDRNYGDRT
jgi:dTDP-glucose 4,6-dehydratase